MKTRMSDLTLDLRYLRFAVAALEHGSFRRAAMALGVPQSSISRRVQALEDRLGIALFERNHAGVRPTEVGKRFLKEAGVGIAQINRAVEAVARVRGGEQGKLNVGIFASLSSGFLRTILHRYAERHAGIKVTLQLGTPDEHAANLIAGQIDIAFLTGDPTVVGCQTLPLWTEHVLVALPKEHPLSSREEIAWADIRDEKLIVTTGGPGPEIADYLIKRLADLSFRPNIEHHDVGRDDLMHMVAIGFGVTLTSDSTLGTGFPDVVFRPMAGQDLLPWSAVWASSNKNPALRRLIACARQQAERGTSAKPNDRPVVPALGAKLQAVILPAFLLAEPAQRLCLSL